METDTGVHPAVVAGEVMLDLYFEVPSVSVRREIAFGSTADLIGFSMDSALYRAQVGHDTVHGLVWDQSQLGHDYVRFSV